MLFGEEDLPLGASEAFFLPRIFSLGNNVLCVSGLAPYVCVRSTICVAVCVVGERAVEVL